MAFLSSLEDYIKASYDELVHKVTWPTLKELTQTAILVLVASLIIALVVFAIDFGIEKVLKIIYSLLSGESV